MKRKSSKEDNVAKEYSLIGIVGNAYVVMAYVAKAMRTEGKTEVEVNSYLERAKSGDYDNLLQVSMEMCEELNNK